MLHKASAAVAVTAVFVGRRHDGCRETVMGVTRSEAAGGQGVHAQQPREQSEHEQPSPPRHARPGKLRLGTGHRLFLGGWKRLVMHTGAGLPAFNV